MSDNLKDPQNTDICIIGGGMVGTSLALLLSSFKLDWNIQIIDSNTLEGEPKKNSVDKFDARTTALSQSSYEIFQALGLWKKLSINTTSINEVHISDKGCFGSVKLKAQEQNLEALGYVIENERINEALFKAVQTIDDIEIIDSAQVNQIQPVSGAVELCYTKKSQPNKTKRLKAKLLVLADGSKSDSRNLLGIESTVKDYGQTAIVTNIIFSKNHNNIAYERFTDSGPLAVLPLKKIDNHNRGALVWTVAPSKAEELLSMPKNEFLKELQSIFGFRLGDLVDVSSRFSYPVKLVVSKEQARSNIVVVGNAVHALHPVAGQGFNLAFRDIAALADKLAKSSSKKIALGQYEVLEEYVEYQARDQQQTILLSDLLPNVFGSRSLFIKVARNIGLLALDSIPLLKTNFAKLGMGLQTRGLRLKASDRSSFTASNSE